MTRRDKLSRDIALAHQSRRDKLIHAIRAAVTAGADYREIRKLAPSDEVPNLVMNLIPDHLLAVCPHPNHMVASGLCEICNSIRHISCYCANCLHAIACSD